MNETDNEPHHEAGKALYRKHADENMGIAALPNASILREIHHKGRELDDRECGGTPTTLMAKHIKFGQTKI